MISCKSCLVFVVDPCGPQPTSTSTQQQDKDVTTMSGRNSNSRKNAATDLEGSHPQELNAQHRHFLVRSLGRNDTDLAALLRVNASLTKLKEQLLEACGELVLLDLGSGRLSLLQEELHFHHNPQPPPSDGTGQQTALDDQDDSMTAKVSSSSRSSNNHINNNNHGVEYTLPPAQKQLCVDFLLRMKLRRKLANRLIRRLNRVAHAMDGIDVSPPPPPRYGDLRLHVSPQALHDFTHHQHRLKAARDYVERAKEETFLVAAATADTTTTLSVEKPNNEQEEKDEMTTLAEPSVVPSGEDKPTDIMSEQQESKDSKDVVETTAVAAPKKEEEEEDGTPPPVAGPEGGMPTIAKEEAAEPAPTLSAPNDANKEAEASTGVPPVDTTGPTSLQEAYEILKEYEDAYSKVWDEESHSWKYVLLANQQEASSSSTGTGTPTATVVPDYQAITAGAAIGATARLLSLQEREQEFKRWQTSILARIPNQPTFEQLGLKNRVFMLEQRRKRCLEDSEGDGANKEARETKKKRVEGDEPNDGSEGEDEDVEDEEVEKPKKIQLAPRKKKEDEEDEEQPATQDNDAPEGLKIIKPMSLAAVPSFYDQDLNRIRAVHGDLMGVSLMEGSRQSLTEATNQYNAGKNTIICIPPGTAHLTCPGNSELTTCSLIQPTIDQTSFLTIEPVCSKTYRSLFKRVERTLRRSVANMVSMLPWPSSSGSSKRWSMIKNVSSSSYHPLGADQSLAPTRPNSTSNEVVSRPLLLVVWRMSLMVHSSCWKARFPTTSLQTFKPHHHMRINRLLSQCSNKSPVRKMTCASNSNRPQHSINNRKNLVSVLGQK